MTTIGQSASEQILLAWPPLKAQGWLTPCAEVEPVLRVQINFPWEDEDMLKISTADDDIALGRVERFESIEDLIQNLHG